MILVRTAAVHFIKEEVSDARWIHWPGALPVGKQRGYYREYIAPELLALVLNEVVERVHLERNLVDDVITGCVYQIGEQGFNLARMAVLESNLPVTIGGITVNRQCGSSLSAIQLASGMIASVEMDTVIASGCEVMSKYGIASDLNCTLSNGQNAGHPISKGYMEKYGIPNQMGAAQAIANRWKITKEECQDFAIASHEKALRATKEGYFRREILPTRAWTRTATRSSVKPTTGSPGVTRAGLDGLKVLPGTDWMTAGLSSTMTDGASAVVLMSGEKVKELGVTP